MIRKGKGISRMIGRALAAALAAALLLCVAGGSLAEELRTWNKEEGYTYVTFGRYPQTVDGGSPDDKKNTAAWRKQYRDWEKATRKELKLKIHDPIDPWDPGQVDPEPILWRVLAADNEKVYLMSEYILFASVMHPDLKEYSEIGADFTKTELGQKLNGPFADAAFTDGEKSVLLPFEDGSLVCAPARADLSNTEMGFSKGKPNTRKAMATEYAIRSTGAIVYQASVGSHTPYWLREQSEKDKKHAGATKQDGGVGHLACYNGDVGARPVINLAADGFRIAGGSGTKEDPYVLEAASGLTETE